MAKFTSKKDMVTSLTNGLSLVGDLNDDDTWHWISYEEISSEYKKGNCLINDEKRGYYRDNVEGRQLSNQ